MGSLTGCHLLQCFKLHPHPCHRMQSSLLEEEKRGGNDRRKWNMEIRDRKRVAALTTKLRRFVMHEREILVGSLYLLMSGVREVYFGASFLALFNTILIYW